MKTVLHGVLFGLLILGAVGCGKDNSSGNSNNRYTSLYNNGLSIDNRQVIDKVRAWYDGVAEGQLVTGLRTVVRTELIYNTAPNCVEKKFLGIPYTYCTYDGSPTSQNEISRNVINLVQDGRRLNEKGNAELASIFNGSQGTLVNAIDVSPTRSELTFLNSNGAVVTFTIDRNVHSLANPIKKSQTSQNSRKDVVVNVF
jgi:hypothetical protein